MFSGFENEDFELFSIDSFAQRMATLKGQLSPKLATIGAWLKDELSQIAGDELFPHVAKHMRRTTNPPNDTWVAFGGKRGYKMGPHFQVCVWSSHVLIQWGLIYEAKQKIPFAKALLKDPKAILRTIPEDFQWSKDHMNPTGIKQKDMSEGDLRDFAHRLIHNKNGEVMVGRVIPKEKAIQMNPTEFHDAAIDAWSHLARLHHMAKSSPS